MENDIALRDLCELIVDCPHSTPKWINSGVLVLRSNNIRGGRLDLSDRSFTNEAHYRQRSHRAELRGGDLVITREAPMGEVCMVPDGLRCCLGQRMVLLRPNNTKCDGRFLLYAIQSPFVQHQIAWSEGTGSTVSNLRIPHLEALRVSTRPIAEQRAIAAVLGSLDDKIEQNRRTGRALEGLARATFKAWFVDFEPVKAKAAGAAGFPGMPSAAFAALPDRLTDSPLGPVPNGWAVGTMGDVGAQRRDQVAPGEVDGETPYIGLEHMPRRDIALSEWGMAASVTSSKFRFRRGDVLFGKLRPYFHKVGPAPLDGVCSTDIVVLYPKRPEYAAWLLMFISSDDFVAHTDRSSAGTKMPRTNWNDMAALAATVPSSALASAFQEWAGPMLELIAASIHESRRLAALRDYLLPRLLSGRVRVRPSQAEGKA